MVVPVHLEFDFSKKRVIDEKTILKSQKVVRLGIGGYAGINLSTKQKLEYKNQAFTYEETIKGDYNTSDLVYGLSGYIGYRDVSFYAKYDLNPIFTDNAIANIKEWLLSRHAHDLLLVFSIQVFSLIASLLISLTITTYSAQQPMVYSVMVFRG